MTLTRRNALILTAGSAAAASLTGFSPALAADGDMHDVEKLMQPNGPADRPIGNPDAKVTMIEYAAPTCPHCARFHINVYPEFKKQYIETDKVRFILRPFVSNVLDAVVFMLAETGDDDAYYAIVDTFMQTQSQWRNADRPRDALLAIALQLGFTEESFEAALTNQELFARMETLREQALGEFDLTGTPTFYVNGKQLSGSRSLEQLAAEIDPLLG